MPWYLVRRYWEGFEEIIVEARNEEWAKAKAHIPTPNYITLDRDAFLGTLVRRPHHDQVAEVTDYIPPGAGIAEEFDQMSLEEWRAKWMPPPQEEQGDENL